MEFIHKNLIFQELFLLFWLGFLHFSPAKNRPGLLNRLNENNRPGFSLFGTAEPLANDFRPRNFSPFFDLGIRPAQFPGLLNDGFSVEGKNLQDLETGNA